MVQRDHLLHPDPHTLPNTYLSERFSKLEQFNGFHGRKFPGQYELKKLEVIPRKDFCPGPNGRIIDEEQEEKFKRKPKACKVDEIHKVWPTRFQKSKAANAKLKVGDRLFKTGKKKAELRVDYERETL